MRDPTHFRGVQVAAFADPRSELRRRLVGRVLAGTKTASAGLLVEYELDGESLPRAGVREVILDAEDRFVGELETTECRILRLADVDDEFAYEDGAGFRDATEWRVAHERYWNGCLPEIRDRLGDPGWCLTDDTNLVCQRFRLVERYAVPIPATSE